MSKSMLKSIFKMLNDHSFETENDHSNDVICIICNKIMIDAHYGPCGCRYCLQCITKYLDVCERICPGNMDDCKIELLNINKNVHNDHPMNIKISKIIVKCPQKDCDIKIELRKFEEHFRVCSSRAVNIPIFDNDVGNNLSPDNYVTMKIFMECIGLLQSEIEVLKKVVAELSLENESLKGKQVDVAHQSRDIDKLNEDMVAVGNIHRSMQGQIRTLISNIQKFEAVNAELKIDPEKQIRKTEMNDKFLEIERKEKEFSARIEDMSREIATLAEKSDSSCQAIDDIEGEMENLQTKLSDIESKQDKLNIGEFVWQIEKFEDKRIQAQEQIESDIFSDHFYSHRNGYKMCLSMFPDGDEGVEGIYLSVYFHIMRGPFDNILQWPFKHDVTLALMNQRTGLAHLSKKLECTDFPNDADWKKPTKDKNGGFGFNKFIKLDELIEDYELCKEDQIFIRCIVHRH